MITDNIFKTYIRFITIAILGVIVYLPTFSALENLSEKERNEYGKILSLLKMARDGLQRNETALDISK